MNRYDIALGKKPVSKPDHSTVIVPVLRGSPDISSNRTSYVDLSQILTGDGSEGNPLNYAQFNSGATSLSTSTGPISISAPYSFNVLPVAPAGQFYTIRNEGNPIGQSIQVSGLGIISATRIITGTES